MVTHLQTLCLWKSRAVTPNAAVVGMQSSGWRFLFPRAGCACSCAGCDCLAAVFSFLCALVLCPLAPSCPSLAGQVWHQVSSCPGVWQCDSGCDMYSKGVQEELNQVDLSVRKNEQNSPSAWRTLKKQCCRPVICWLLWESGKNLAQSFEDRAIDVSPGLHRA